MDDDRQRFLDFERAGWDEVAVEYADLTADAVAQTLDPILDAAGVGRDTRVLDVACGPGALAQRARERGAVVMGIDVSEVMVRLARSRVAGLDVRRGAAEALPVGDRVFDAVISSFGLPHFADPSAAFAEMRRALAPGGRVALATWMAPADNPLFAVILGAIAKAGDLGLGASLPTGTDMFAYADQARADGDLTDAGFDHVGSSDHTIWFALRDVEHDIARFYRSASVRSRGLFRAHEPHRQNAIVAAAVTHATAIASEPDERGLRHLPARYRIITPHRRP